MGADTFNEKKEFKSSFKWSLIAHGVVFGFFIIKGIAFKGDPIDYSAAIRVDIVALPDKLDPSKVTLTKPEAKVEVKPKAETKPEPKVDTAKVIPLPEKKAKPEPDTISLTKTKAKQQDALEKLKKQSALEKIKSELEKEQAQQEALQKISQVKGNVVAPGTALTGLNKLQHDSYVSDLDTHIKSHWAIPEWMAKQDFKAQVRLRLDDKGQIVSREIAKSSGNPAYDDIVIATIDKSAPFPRPPEKLAAVVRVQGILIGFPE